MTGEGRKEVSRQHEDTEVSELYGEICGAFLAVCSVEQTPTGPMYIRLGSEWHRFYLDAGLLFWLEGRGPSEDDDLLDDEAYVDWGVQLGVQGVPIVSVVMSDSTLSLSFENGAWVVLKHGPQDEATAVLEFNRGG